jgi:flagellar biosynthesis protein FlhB
MKILLSTLDIVFYLLIRLVVIVMVVSYLSSCYEYRKFPNTKRVTKRDVRKAMKFSTSESYISNKSIYNNSVHK